MIEIIHPNPAPGRIRLAVFDFDGTVSLLRQGWQQQMIELAVELIPPRSGESVDEIRALATELVQRTNGQPTLAQMQCIADEIRARGGAADTPSRIPGKLGIVRRRVIGHPASDKHPAQSLVGDGVSSLEAEAYKQMYLARLMQLVEPRRHALETGAVPPETWRVPGVQLVLEALRARRIPCYLVSGTDQEPVRREAAALGLADYFAGIYGATEDFENSTKAAFFARIVQQHALQPYEWVAFGDGVEEIRLCKAWGGLAIGVAYDPTGAEMMAPSARARLIAAGADALISDFQMTDAILQYLFA